MSTQRASGSRQQASGKRGICIPFEVALAGLCIAFAWFVIAALCTDLVREGPAKPRGTPSESEEHAMPGLSDTATAELVRLYGRAMDDVNAMAGKAMLEIAAKPERRASQFRLLRAASLQEQIAQRMAALNAQVDRTLTPALVRSQTTAITKAERESAELLGVGIENRAIERLAEDSAAVAGRQIRASMDNAVAQHAENTERVFRQLAKSPATATEALRATTEREVNAGVARGLIAGDPRLIEREVRKALGAGLIDDASAMSFRRLGNQQITIGGWTGSLRQYAMTVARTRSAEAANVAAVERMTENGIELASIEGNNTRNFCSAFLGLVVGLQGSVTIDGVTYPGLNDIPGAGKGGPPFHPNCSKGLAPFDPELSSPARVKASLERLAVFQQRKEEGTLRDEWSGSETERPRREPNRDPLVTVREGRTPQFPGSEPIPQRG